MTNLEVVAIIKGEYTDHFGHIQRYEYRVFNVDTMEKFLQLASCEINRHPYAKQSVVFTNQLTQLKMKKYLNQKEI